MCVCVEGDDVLMCDCVYLSVCAMYVCMYVCMYMSASNANNFNALVQDWRRPFPALHYIFC